MNSIPKTRPRIIFKWIFDAQARENFDSKITSMWYYDHDHRANSQVFKKDDYVYLLKEPLRVKFDEQYKESYKILENHNIKLAISNKLRQELCIVIS